MSFQLQKTHLENIFKILQQQSESTAESWNDPVQRRFYEEFINSLPKEFIAYINELTRIGKSFEQAEQHISRLQE